VMKRIFAGRFPVSEESIAQLRRDQQALFP
jgi:hypothetical protein